MNIKYYKEYLKSENQIKLFWHKSINYGDQLSEYIANKLSGKEVVYVNQDSFNFMNIGSILSTDVKNSIICGNGFANYKDVVYRPLDILSVRGLLTYFKLLKNNINCPKIYGDPSLIMKEIFNPKIEKQYKLGIIPHIIDYDFVVNEIFENNIPENYLVIDLKINENNTIENITEKIISCEKTISSSLHGIIISHAYDIPCNWVKFSDKILSDGFKYHDYFSSINIRNYIPTYITNKEQIEKEEIQNLNIKINYKQILNNCPFYL